MFHVYNSLDLCSFMDISFTSVLIWIYIYMFFYGCHVQPADITERRSTHVRIRIHGRARTSIARVAAQYARFLNSGTTAALTIPIYYKYID